MAAIICGSLAFDSIMNFGGKFSDQILPNQLHNLNVSFFVPTLRREYGGCAGNIAYALKQLGGTPLIMATVGSVRGYRMWVSEDALVGHHLPSDDTPGVTTAGPVLLAPSDRLPVVLLTLADIPPRGSEPSEIPTMDGRALWAWLRDDRILAPDCHIPPERLFKMARSSGNEIVLTSCLILDPGVVRVTQMLAAEAVHLEAAASLDLVQEVLELAVSERHGISDPVSSPATRVAS